LHEHEGHSPQRPPSVFFNDITDTAFNIAVTYFFSPPDGQRFAIFNEGVNVRILERFEHEGIELATPRQILELADGARQALVTPTRRDSSGPPETAAS
jgi:small-conductance mechanosensitive channel